MKAMNALLAALKEDYPDWGNPDCADDPVSHSYEGQGQFTDSKLTYGMIAGASDELDRIVIAGYTDET